MAKKIILLTISAILGIWLASSFVPGVEVKLLSDSSFFGIRLTAVWQIYVLLGIIIGLLNFFIKPILDLITLPLRIITLGLFGFLINIALIWVVDVMFKEFSVPLIWPLLYTTLIVFALNIVISIIFKKEK